MKNDYLLMSMFGICVLTVVAVLLGSIDDVLRDILTIMEATP